jgi:hypothetical protein
VRSLGQPDRVPVPADRGHQHRTRQRRRYGHASDTGMRGVLRKLHTRVRSRKSRDPRNGHVVVLMNVRLFATAYACRRVQMVGIIKKRIPKTTLRMKAKTAYDFIERCNNLQNVLKARSIFKRYFDVHDVREL